MPLEREGENLIAKREGEGAKLLSSRKEGETLLEEAGKLKQKSGDVQRGGRRGRAKEEDH